jgi:hypothetical protein
MNYYQALPFIEAENRKLNNDCPDGFKDEISCIDRDIDIFLEVFSCQEQDIPGT